MKSRRKDVELGVRDRVNLVAHGTESVHGEWAVLQQVCRLCSPEPSRVGSCLSCRRTGDTAKNKQGAFSFFSFSFLL